MNWQDLAHKKVALLGAGIENIALIPHLERVEAQVTICNQNKTEATERLAHNGHKLVIGQDYLRNLDSYDYVFRIAGMPTATLNSALKNLTHKPDVTSPTDLFLALKPCRIIGVTGTKGKGTTSTLIGSILEAAGKEVFVVGNIGRPIFEIFDSLKKDSYAVVELSSFQLEDVHTSPEVAVILPVTEDHLQPVSQANPNFHPTLKDYQDAKAKITQFQTSSDLLVFTNDSKETEQIAQASVARKISVGTHEADIVISEAGRVSSDGQEWVDLMELGLKGQHVFLNAACAVAVARAIDCDLESIKKGLRAFKPLPHRMQTFAHHNGRIFVDDSYATNPTATQAALTAFTEPVVIILGGASIGTDFTELAKSVVKSSVKATVLIGEEALRLEQSLKAAEFSGEIVTAGTFHEAVEASLRLSSQNEVILLSPACKSFDMFKNATDRGEQFQKIVRELHADA